MEKGGMGIPIRKAVIAIAAVVAIVAAVYGCSPSQKSSSNSSSTSSTASAGESSDASTKASTGTSALDTSGRLGNNVGYTTSGRYKDNIAELPSLVSHDDKDAKNATVNAPRSYIDSNGFTVQPVPSDETGWNISYLNADNRGCTSCHALEDVMLSMDTYHGITFMGYPTEQTYANCFVCHEWATPLETSIHSIHNGNAAFNSMGGTCESCHYIDDKGNFLRWDYEKYDLYKGITDIASNDKSADIQTSYDQDTLTDVDDMFYKSIKSYGGWDPTNWRLDDSNMDPDLYNNWVFTVGGEVENPISMTLPELVEKFGTHTATMKQQCCVNGVGNAMIMQCEVEGVRIKDIIDYVKPASSVNCYEMLSEDPYPNTTTDYHLALSMVEDPDALLVVKVNGQTLPNSQGYPVAAWIPNMSAASACKVMTGINFITTTDTDAITCYYIGDFEDPAVGTAASKPNSAVLNYPSGIVLDNAVGTPVTLEGFADAWDEPIEKVEFSLDHGKTWTVMETPNNDAERWNYWRLTFTPPNAGAYLLDIRTTSIKPDGTNRVCAWNTQFLLNVN